MAYIEFDNVVKSYGSGDAEVRALDGASFSVERGELAVVLGASGAGKTTSTSLVAWTRPRRAASRWTAATSRRKASRSSWSTAAPT